MTQRRALVLSIIVTLLLAFTVVGLRAVAIDDTPDTGASAQVIRLTDDISTLQGISGGDEDDDRYEDDESRDDDDEREDRGSDHDEDDDEDDDDDD